MLQVAVLELDVGRHGRGQLDERVVEQRHARLEPVRHAHAVLDLQQGRQEGLEVEVGHAVEVATPCSTLSPWKIVLEGLERRVAAERIPVDLVPEVGRAVDQPEVARVEIVEQAVAPELLQQRLVLAKRTRFGMIDS